MIWNLPKLYSSSATVVRIFHVRNSENGFVLIAVMLTRLAEVKLVFKIFQQGSPNLR